MSNSGSSDEENDVDPELLLSELSADTMAALQGHLDRKNVSDSDSDDEDSAAAQGAGVSEDFGMSQFWYDAETSRRLGQEALDHAKGGVIAIISAPSAYKKLLDLEPNRKDAYCFEYDPRFGCFGDAFVKYDFHQPDKVPAELLGKCDYIMVDPPYLNPDAVAKYSQTIRLLAKKRDREQPTATDSAASPPVEPEPEPEPESGAAAGDSMAAGARVDIPVLYLSGAVVRDAVLAELGLRPCTFTPSFASKLSNQFHCYTNYESQLLGPFLEDD